MTIAGRLRAAAIVPALAALLTIAVLVLTHRVTSQVQHKLRTSRQLATGVGELNDLVRAYLLHRDERPVQQFHAALADLRNLMAGARFGDPAQDRLRTSVGDAVGLMGDAFDRLTSETAISEAAGGTALAREAEERLSGQVLVRSREAQSDVARLEGLLEGEAATANRRTGFLVMALVLAMAAVVTVILVPLTGGITRSLARLAKGVAAVGSGDLSHRVGIHSIDEIGDVSRSFDLMAGRLQETIVSRDALAAEVEQRKLTEERLNQSQRTFLELVERSPFGTYVIDSQFRIAHMNAASQTGAFRNVKPVIGRDFSEAMRILWPEPVAAEIIGHFRHTLETGEPYYSPRFINPRQDVGTVESYEWELQRMRLPDGQYGVICYYYDSTRLREAEAALRESEAKANAMVKYAPTGIYELEFKGRKFISVNDAMCRILGYTREELFAVGPMGLLDEESRGRFADRVKRTLSGQKIDETVDYRVRRKDGSFIDAVLYVTFSAGGDRALVVAHDVTARKQAEERIASQLAELQRWQAVMLDREDRVMALKREVNELLIGLGKPIRYESQAGEDTETRGRGEGMTRNE